MTFTPTADQGAALQVFADFMRADAPAPGQPCLRARLRGYAGTGKTTIIRLLAAMWRQAFGRPVAVLAPTGKASLRVREATGEPASTIHRWLYMPRQDTETGEMAFIPKDIEMMREEGWEDALVVIDEASMVGRYLWTHLEHAVAALGARLLLVGDPFQLEPIDEEGFCALNLESPWQADLREVVRQALDSPVLRAATLIRTASDPFAIGQALALLNRLDRQRAVSAWCAEHPEIPVLVHRNATRHKINEEVRALRGLPPGAPQPGEPLLILRNTYGIDRYNGEVIQAGQWVGATTEVAVKDRKTNATGYRRYGLLRVERGGPALLINGQKAEAPDPTVIVSADAIGGERPDIGEWATEIGARDAWRRELYERAVAAGVPADVRPPFLHANYGYSLTCHKSQGSEWPEVCVVIEDSIRLHEIGGRRWLYTATTRAKNRVHLGYA